MKWFEYSRGSKLTEIENQKSLAPEAYLMCVGVKAPVYEKKNNNQAHFFAVHLSLSPAQTKERKDGSGNMALTPMMITIKNQ